MELIQGSETSVNYNLTPGKYPEENIQFNLKLMTSTCTMFFVSTTNININTKKALHGISNDDIL